MNIATVEWLSRWNTDRSGHNWGRNIWIQRKLRFATPFRRRTQGAHRFDWRTQSRQCDSASRTSKKKRKNKCKTIILLNSEKTFLKNKTRSKMCFSTDIILVSVFQPSELVRKNLATPRTPGPFKVILKVQLVYQIKRQTDTANVSLTMQPTSSGRKTWVWIVNKF